MRAVFDTNILVDYLNGVKAAKTELDKYTHPMVSIVTWMEVLVGAVGDEEETLIKRFLQRFAIIPIDEPLAAEAVQIRRQHKIRLPDAIIWATARREECPLVTRNTRDFPKDHPTVRVPYKL